jgi:hypothetical protein
MLVKSGREITEILVASVINNLLKETCNLPQGKLKGKI